MPRQPRSQLPDGIYHVTARAVAGLSLFVEDNDRRTFLWLLGETLARFDVRCLAYCLMGTHYHLVLEGTTANLAVAMRHLNGQYARNFNERRGRSGHVFAQRYSTYAICDQRHLKQVLDYIADNPVKADLCGMREDWPWTWIGDDFGRTVPVPAVLNE